MAIINILGRGTGGAIRNVDLSANTLWVDVLRVGSASPTDLTKVILDNLVALQNGSDFANGTNAHTHDGRYFTESELSSATASSGSDLIGDDNTYSNFTPSAATVKGALAGIDAALAAAGSNDFSDALFRISDNGDSSKKIAFEASGISASTVRTITMPDANVNLADANNAVLVNGSRAFTANQPMGGFKLTGLAAGSASGDSVRYEQAVLVNGANAFTADQSHGGFKITNLANGTASGDAVNYSQLQAVQSMIENFEWQPSVLDVQVDNTLDPGATPTTGDRYLITDSANLHANFGTITGVADDDIVEYDGADFVVAFTPSAPGPFVSSDAAPDRLYYYGGASWVEKYFEATTASTGLTKVGFDVRLDSSSAGSGLAFASGVLSVNVDNSTIEINSDTLRVKAAGINENHLAASVAGAGLTGGAGSALAVGAGDGIDVAADSISVDVVDIAGAGIENDGSNNLRIASAAYDQSTITGGSGSAAAVQHAPKTQKVMVAGESFAANTSFLVRWALTGETAGRVYKADKDASSTNKYMAHGIAHSTSAVSAGQNITVTVLGTHVLGSSDAAFAAGDVGKEVYLTAAGAFSLTAPSAVNEAVFVIGTVENTDRIWVDMKQLRYIN